MVKRTHAEWQTLFNEHDQSGLTAAAFCREKNLCPRYFSLRRRQLTGKPGKEKPVAAPFIQARVQPSTQSASGGILLRCGASEPRNYEALSFE